MPDITLTPKSVRIADDEAKWLSTAATKGGVTAAGLAPFAQGTRCGQPNQARGRDRHRQGLQIQAHPAARHGDHHAGPQDQPEGVQKREADVGESPEAPSR